MLFVGLATGLGLALLGVPLALLLGVLSGLLDFVPFFGEDGSILGRVEFRRECETPTEVRSRNCTGTEPQKADIEMLRNWTALIDD